MTDLLLIIFCGLIAIPVVVLLVQISMSLFPLKSKMNEVVDQKINVAVLIPAHNEETVIRETINAIKSQLKNDDRIFVVADNCSDNTANLARDLDTKVLERVDTDKRGKGYALDFGINHIMLLDDKPDVLVIIDADCHVEEGGIKKLAARSIQSHRPVQALYVMKSSKNASPNQKIAEFAWIVKTHIRPRGFLKMGLPCQLMGTGMAFPLNILKEVNLASSHIVEDVKLGIDLARKGYCPLFCPDIQVVSTFPDKEASIKSQRTRWEHGHLNTILSEGLGLLKESIKRKDICIVAMLFDLMVPPLALLALILFLTLIITVLLGVFSNVSSMPLMIVIIACMLFGISVLLAWGRFGSQLLTFGELVSFPGYVFSKIPIYIRFWTKRQKDWIRTDRE